METSRNSLGVLGVAAVQQSGAKGFDQKTRTASYTWDAQIQIYRRWHAEVVQVEIRLGCVVSLRPGRAAFRQAGSTLPEARLQPTHRLPARMPDHMYICISSACSDCMEIVCVRKPLQKKNGVKKNDRLPSGGWVPGCQECIRKLQNAYRMYPTKSWPESIPRGKFRFAANIACKVNHWSVLCSLIFLMKKILCARE